MGGIDMLPERKNIRLPYYDYHTNGMYFVTVCTKEKEHLFGEVIDGEKVSINSAAIRHPELINEIANHYGSQVCVCAIDARADGLHLRPRERDAALIRLVDEIVMMCLPIERDRRRRFFLGHVSLLYGCWSVSM